MKLKLRRYTKQTGTVFKSRVFCLDARLELTDAEREGAIAGNIYSKVIWSSQKAKEHLARAKEHEEEGTFGGFMAAATAEFWASRSDTISIESLDKGQHLECETLDQVLGAKEAIMRACRTISLYLKAASTFNGTEEVFAFGEDGEPELLAEARP